MGTSPQEGVRVLRHDVDTGAVLDDRYTDATGIANFGMIGTSRSTISLIEEPGSPGDPGAIFTLVGFKVGAVTLLGFVGPEPASLLNFNVEMTGVPNDANVAAAYLGATEEVNGLPASVTPPTATVPGIDVRFLQPDGRFSVLTQVGISGTGVTACGMMLDVDPATITSGEVMKIDTSAVASSIPFVADVPVFILGTVIRRSSLVIDAMDIDANYPASTPAAIGMFPYCEIPGADRYDFVFETEETLAKAGRTIDVLFDVPPDRLNVTMPDLNITGLSRNGRTISWTPSGSDLDKVDLVFVNCEWHYQWPNTATLSHVEWSLIAADSTTSLTLPRPPGDLMDVFEPPTTGVDFEAGLVDSDVLSGFDAFVSQISAMGGNFSTLVMASSLISIACKSGSN
jgi:hypothetical protein